MDLMRLLFSLLFSLLQLDPGCGRVPAAADRVLQDLTRLVLAPRPERLPAAPAAPPVVPACPDAPPPARRLDRPRA